MEERNEILKLSLAALMRRFASTQKKKKKKKTCHAWQARTICVVQFLKSFIDDICRLSWHSPRALIVWTFKSRSAVNTKKSRPVFNHNVENRTTSYRYPPKCLRPPPTGVASASASNIAQSSMH